MSDARAIILGRIERALRTAHIPKTDDGHASGAERDIDVPGTRAADAAPSVQDRFLVEARALGVETFVEASAAAVRDRLRETIGERRVLSWNPERLPYGTGAVVAGALLGSAPVREQADAEIGVTGCDAAVAETGSLALISGPGASRTVSLLPPVHVALVRPQDLVPTMGEFFAANAAAMAAASSCTFVTGPSRTADIELSLTIGVHGPGRVVVIVGP
jgi:L-lactate dehydrogenase complex protein LldG